MSVMCDKQTTTWCGRISLLFIIFGILLTMMIQIWSYYYSLVIQMDNEILKAPVIEGLVDLCDKKLLNQWNMNNCSVVKDKFVCDMSETANDVFLYTSGSGNVSFKNNKLFVQPVESCVKVLILGLPWE